MVLLAVLAVSLPVAARCQETRDGLGDVEKWAEAGTRDVRTGMSLAPILAYEPTFGTIIGGAIFLERPENPRFRLMSRVGFSTEGEYSVLFDRKQWLKDNTFYRLELEVDSFARPYYGEGMTTLPDRKIMLDGTVSRARLMLKWRGHLGSRISFGPFLDFRGANLDAVDGTDLSAPQYDEATLGLGFRFFYDGRDSSLSPTHGVFDTLTLRLVPEPLSNFDDMATFLQAEVDHRNFVSLGRSLVLGWKLFAGATWGRPSYQYRYSLGGPYDLRGYFTNRFRGDKIYVAQMEVRQRVTRILGSTMSVAAFGEVGEVTDHWFGDPETSYGGGLRLTLPPDHVAKVRLDFAWAEDQESIYFIFGEAF